MKDEFGYFGSGLEGYIHYNEAFKRNFDNATPENTNESEAREASSGDDNLFGDASDKDYDHDDDSDDKYNDIDTEEEDDF